MPAFVDSSVKALPSRLTTKAFLQQRVVDRVLTQVLQSNETFDLLLYTRSDRKIESAAESLFSTKAGLSTTSTVISNPIARDQDNKDIVFWCRS